MESVKLAILGAGSVRCSVPVLASLATYFGERPMEVALYDADAERLDLFDMFARLAFAQNENTHTVSASESFAEVLAGASKVIIQIDANCALKEARAANRIPARAVKDRLEETLARIGSDIPGDAQVVSLLPQVRLGLDYYYKPDWPRHLDEDEIRSLPHQVLRWIRGEEYIYELLREHERSPLKVWLDNPTTATIVSAEKG